MTIYWIYMAVCLLIMAVVSVNAFSETCSITALLLLGSSEFFLGCLDDAESDVVTWKKKWYSKNL
jgi:hypothetical protein